nr:polynucleotide kinase-phosphatase [Sorangium cellulosum]
MSAPRPLVVPALSLVVLVGASGSGKSTFARAHFKPTEILSSDHYRGVVSDDENEQAASADAFEVLRFIAGKRLAAGRLTVVDATNVQADARRPLVQLAREHHVLPVAIVLDMPEKLCHARNAGRPDRQFGPHVVRGQSRELRRALRDLRREGFRYVHVLSSPEEVAAAVIERQRLWTDRRDDHGPFDVIGDVHGCLDELVELLEALGYRLSGLPDAPRAEHPDGRRAIFVGDLVDRGPRSPDVLRLVMAMVEAGTALCVAGNHEVKLLRKLRGKDVRVTHGLERTLEQLAAESDAFKAQVAGFLDGLISHYLLDDGKLAVAHAGVKEAFQGRGSGAVRDFCLYGETTGEMDEYGLPVRYNWASEYRGRAMVVYGHTPTTVAEWENRTICIDTGCVFGGALTALRYPERELVEVKARRVYYEPARPLAPRGGAPGAEPRGHDDALDIDDVRGRRAIRTRAHGMVTIREENAAAALEAMSRFAADPRWLIYLPPTMSPSETAKDGGLLEHPREALAYFRQSGVGRVVCEEKHMGSRAVLVACRDEAARRRRFRVDEGPLGACVTRTGRPFFADEARGQELIDRVRAAMDRAGLWDELGTDWVCLDAELLPWSAKAQDLLRGQYAAVGAAGRASLGAAVRALEQAAARDESARPLLERHAARRAAMDGYVAAYRRYCWPVRSLADLRLAPFHLLASEGAVHAARDHGFTCACSPASARPIRRCSCRPRTGSSTSRTRRARPRRWPSGQSSSRAAARGWW